MAKTGERMLELLDLLQLRHRWSGEELAERLDVSERTVRRDVDRLRELGYPVHSDRGVDGGYQLGVGTKLPPLLLSDDEAVAIAIGLRTAAHQPIVGIAESSTGALLKVGQLLTPALQERIESIASAVDPRSALNTEPVPLATLTTLARAGRDSERVRFTYTGFDSRETDRHVEPHHVVPVGQRWYLIGWDLDRDDWRTFRLDRITEPLSTRRLFSPRQLPASDPESFIRDRTTALRSIHHVELVVETPVEAVERHMGPWGSTTAIDERTTRIEMNIPDLAWAVLMLGILNAEIRSVEPPEFAQYLESLSHRLLDAARRAS